jgi:hypothetical protein
MKREKSLPLLDDLAGIPDKNLGLGVARSEGLSGSSIEPIYSRRRLKCYTITESEIHQIGLANIGITAFTALGSAFFAFWLDLTKDIAFASEIPKGIEPLISYVQPILMVLAFAFWVIALGGVFWRSRMLKIIKSESSEAAS